MKASELIQILQEIIDVDGDLLVEVFDPEYADNAEPHLEVEGSLETGQNILIYTARTAH